MIHHYALIAEFEYDDENGEYDPPSSWEMENGITLKISNALDVKEVHFEIARGTLHEAFGVPEIQ